MPTATLKSLAKKSGKSLARAEHLWDKAKEIVSKEYPKIDHDSDKHWALVVGIVKKMMGLKEAITFAEMIGTHEVTVEPGELVEEDTIEEAKAPLQVNQELMKLLRKTHDSGNMMGPIAESHLSEDGMKAVVVHMQGSVGSGGLKTRYMTSKYDKSGGKWEHKGTTASDYKSDWAETMPSRHIPSIIKSFMK